MSQDKMLKIFLVSGPKNSKQRTVRCKLCSCSFSRSNLKFRLWIQHHPKTTLTSKSKCSLSNWNNFKPKEWHNYLNRSIAIPRSSFHSRWDSKQTNSLNWNQQSPTKTIWPRICYRLGNKKVVSRKRKLISLPKIWRMFKDYATK